ncbi:MAG: hypothetical protein GY906_35735 [bacterium]|nr:hypothetical protein [bacterium]
MRVSSRGQQFRTAIFSITRHHRTWFVVTVCLFVALMVGLATGDLIAQVPDLIFADGFESGDTSAWTSTEPSSSIPYGLPHHLGLGLTNSPSNLDWMTDSGIAWDYRYQYLAGGVNTGDGWATWNSPPGQFVTYYLNASANAGYLPVLTYYTIVQSDPYPYTEPPDGNLNTPATMNAYFEDFKLLMTKAGDDGRTVIIHVEPDLWGYMQSFHGDDPANTSVSVASSGFAEAAGFANNARGFAQLLVALRDTYAPNAILAWHVSNWATGTDLSINNGDGEVLGLQVVDFYQGLGADFDLMFFDPSDRDSGYKQVVLGQGPSAWWDADDFDRFRIYIQTICNATDLKAMLWQVPIGNQLYRSCNNSEGHYQDNRPEYYLGNTNQQHLIDSADAGVIAILFGGGSGACTSYRDAEGDGITNPPPINGNDLIAVYADDDGGNLRLSAAAYYDAGVVPVN